MAGYIYLVAKLARSLKSDIMKDKPNNSVVDVPVGGPSPHQIKVEYVRDGLTSLGLQGRDEDADSVQEQLDIVVNKTVGELKGKTVKQGWHYDNHNALQKVTFGCGEGCIYIDLVPVVIQPSVRRWPLTKV